MVVYPHYGSDVEATLSAGYDIRHGLIGAGVYASHGYERSHIDGVMNTLNGSQRLPAHLIYYAKTSEPAFLQVRMFFIGYFASSSRLVA